MTLLQEIITIALCVAGTMLTRFLPFLVFGSKRPTPRYIQYLGKVLPGAIFAMLVIYCLRNVSVFQGSHGLPELIAIATGPDKMQTTAIAKVIFHLPTKSITERFLAFP